MIFRVRSHFVSHLKLHAVLGNWQHLVKPGGGKSLAQLSSSARSSALWYRSSRHSVLLSPSPALQWKKDAAGQRKKLRHGIRAEARGRRPGPSPWPKRAKLNSSLALSKLPVIFPVSASCLTARPTCFAGRTVDFFFSRRKLERKREGRSTAQTSLVRVAAVVCRSMSQLYLNTGPGSWLSFACCEGGWESGGAAESSGTSSPPESESESARSL